MDKHYCQLHEDFYHNEFGARRPIPHEHDQNDKVRTDCYDYSASYLEDKFVAGKGISITKEIDEEYNSRLVISSTRGEDETYHAGYGINSDLLEDGYISVSGFEDYITKEEASANYTPLKSWKKTDFDLSILYNSAKNYYDTSYNILKENSASWNNNYAPGESMKEHLDFVEEKVDSLTKISPYWDDTYNVVSVNSGKWNDFTSVTYVPISTFSLFKRDYEMAMDIFQHQLNEHYNLIKTLSAKVEELSGKINNEENING